MRATRREFVRASVVGGLGATIAGASGQAAARDGYELLLRAAGIAARTSDELRAIAEMQQEMVRSRQLPSAATSLLTEQSRRIADLSAALRDVESLIRQAGRLGASGDCA